jgi:NADPH:quinone reductase-like Zn-dependent oxidoreductase
LACALDVALVCIDARQAHQSLKAMKANKTDPRDAAELAQLARTGFYKEVHVKSPAAHDHDVRLMSRERRTTGLSVGQRVFGLTDWYRDGALAEYVAVEARNLAPLPGDVDFTEGAALVMSGLTAWQGLFEHGRLRAGQSVIAHGAAGVVGSMVTQLAREAGAHVIGSGRAADRQKALDFGAQEFVDLENDALEDVGPVDLVFDLFGGDIGKRSAALIRAGGTLVTIAGPAEAQPANGVAVDFVVESDRAQLSEIVQRVRDGRVRTNIGKVSTLDKAVAAFNSTERRAGKTVIRVRP